jgi:hypothetical protein
MKTAALSRRQVKTAAAPHRNRIAPSISCVDAAKILREANRMLSPQDRMQIAAGIEDVRRRMNNEHLH